MDLLGPDAIGRLDFLDCPLWAGRMQRGACVLGFVVVKIGPGAGQGEYAGAVVVGGDPRPVNRRGRRQILQSTR